MPAITPTNVLTSQVLGSIVLAGAEISAYDSATSRVFTTSDSGLQIIDLSDPSHPQLIETVTFAFSNDVSSVAVYNGLVAVAVISPNRTDPGRVYLLNADGDIQAVFTVGAVPDMVTFTPDGSRILVANEGEATSALAVSTGTPYVNPVGSISVITIATGTVQTAGFEAFNSSVATAALIAEGVRLYVNTPGFNNPTVAQDLEPEYIAVAPDGRTAWVTLQEANAIAVLDLTGAAPVVTDILPLGLKDWSLNGLKFDSRDTTVPDFRTGLPVFGMYMPDAIASYAVGGQTYYVTANEGDDRNDFLPTSPSSATETRRLGSLNLDDATFPSEVTLKMNAFAGRLNVSQLAGINGDTDGDGDIDQILTYGARSFTIRNAAGTIVFDSGDQIDTFVAEYFPELYADGRSDDKGSEPEGVTIATVDGRVYAFVTLERYNSTIVYDITDPTAPTLTTLLANVGDLRPEQGIFVSAADSATGQPLFIVSNEISNTLTVYELTTPKLVGGNGNDELVGTITADVMTGGNGDDFIYANAGDDQLFGGNGDDTLDGGRGNDRLDGGRGADTLTTGLGADVILINRQGGGEDIVTDFDIASDSLLLGPGIRVTRSSLDDRDGDGIDDLILYFNRGGSLVLLGVWDPGVVDLLG